VNSKRNSQSNCKHILFFATHKADTQKNKKSLQGNAPRQSNMDRQQHGRKEVQTANTGFAKKRIQCLI
jgi:hypothetical protein